MGEAFLSKTEKLEWKQKIGEKIKIQ
jgi:hypothetical protein